MALFKCFRCKVATAKVFRAESAKVQPSKSFPVYIPFALMVDYSDMTIFDMLVYAGGLCA